MMGGIPPIAAGGCRDRDKRFEEKKELPMRWEKSACVLNERESGPLEDVKIKYIYEGAWISRMIVSFFILVRKLRKK